MPFLKIFNSTLHRYYNVHTMNVFDCNHNSNR